MATLSVKFAYKVERGISPTVREGSAVYGAQTKRALPNGRASAPIINSAPFRNGTLASGFSRLQTAFPQG
jgi:hypothetical protein